MGHPQGVPMLKKVLKVVLVVLVLLVVAAAGFVSYCAIDWPRHTKTQAINLTVQVTPERVARGKEIASVLCAGCHYDQATGGLTGRRIIDAPKQFGTLYSHNITQDPNEGIGTYTDGQLAYLLRTGVERSGVFPGPFMGHPHMSDEDMASVIAFLRSDDPWVKPQAVANQTSKASLLYKVLDHSAFQPFDYPDAPIAAPDPKDTAAYGQYLATSVFDCYACHSADFKTDDFNHPEKSKRFFGGGNPTLDSDGNVVYSANLTFDKDTGIGAWSEEQFRRALKTGFRPDGRPLRYPMEPMPELGDDEVADMYAYLQTVPVISNVMDRWANQPTVADSSEGAQIYQKYSCISCHGLSGVGVCDVREAFSQFHSDSQVIDFLHNPSQFFPDSKMPTWDGVIQESEYAPLLAYVHTLADSAGPLPRPAPPLPTVAMPTPPQTNPASGPASAPLK
jgi:mono/diheme cytochrome c family protein